MRLAIEMIEMAARDDATMKERLDNLTELGRSIQRLESRKARKSKKTRGSSGSGSNQSSGVASRADETADESMQRSFDAVESLTGNDAPEAEELPSDADSNHDTHLVGHYS